MPVSRIARRLALAVAAIAALTATAKETGLAACTGPEVKVLETYTAPTKLHQKNAEVYARFVNVETTDRLVGADSPVCERVELVAGDGTRRRYESFQFQEDVEIGFREGAPHLRLVGLKRPLVRGQSFPVTLHFEEDGPLTLNVTVQ
jgi:copper(I)-binding protein